MCIIYICAKGHSAIKIFANYKRHRRQTKRKQKWKWENRRKRERKNREREKEVRNEHDNDDERVIKWSRIYHPSDTRAS